jgi:hypothetical protein
MLLTLSFQDKKIHNWRADDLLDQYLRTALPSALIDAEKNKPSAGLHGLVGLLENAFLQEADAHRHASVSPIDQVAAHAAEEQRAEVARAYFAPELARIVAQQISILGRLVANFITASVGKHPLPGDQLESFRPWQSVLYPTAAQFRDLSAADATSLIEFYDSLQEITEVINSWTESATPLDVNAFNYLMQKVQNSLDIGRNAVQRFCPERQYSAIMPSGGTLIDRLQLAVSSAQLALTAHLARHGVG